GLPSRPLLRDRLPLGEPPPRLRVGRPRSPRDRQRLRVRPPARPRPPRRGLPHRPRHLASTPRRTRRRGLRHALRLAPLLIAAVTRPHPHTYLPGGCGDWSGESRRLFLAWL